MRNSVNVQLGNLQRVNVHAADFAGTRLEAKVI